MLQWSRSALLPGEWKCQIHLVRDLKDQRAAWEDVEVSVEVTGHYGSPYFRLVSFKAAQIDIFNNNGSNELFPQTLRDLSPDVELLFSTEGLFNIVNLFVLSLQSTKLQFLSRQWRFQQQQTENSEMNPANKTCRISSQLLNFVDYKFSHLIVSIKFCFPLSFWLCSGEVHYPGVILDSPPGGTKFRPF